MNDLTIPDKCEECEKREPNKVIFETGMGRNFSKCYFSKFICDACYVQKTQEEDLE